MQVRSAKASQGDVHYRPTPVVGVQRAKDEYASAPRVRGVHTPIEQFMQLRCAPRSHRCCCTRSIRKPLDPAQIKKARVRLPRVARKADVQALAPEGLLKSPAGVRAIRTSPWEIP